MKAKQVHPPAQSKRRLILPLLLAFIFIMSIFGFVIGSLNPDTSLDLGIDRGGYIFTPVADGRWNVVVNDMTLSLATSPDDLIFSELDVSFGSLNVAQKVYVTREPNEAVVASNELYSLLRSSRTTFPTCLKDGPGCEQLPLKTCSDARDRVVVIQLLLDDQRDFEVEGACYTLRGDETSLIRMVDTFVLGSYGVSL